MRIAHVSDFHFTCLTWNPFRLFPKRILANFNWLFFRKKHFFDEQLEPLPALFTSLGVDLVLLGGDFTTTALSEEFELAAAFVKEIQQPWIAIPGNHDHYTYRSHRNKHFYRYFANRKKAEFFTLKEQGIEAHQIAPDWWLIALDTSLATHPYSSEGFLSEELEARLEETLRRIPQDDAIAILNHYPFFQNDEPRRTLKRGDALQALLKRHPRIRLYLHGHTHRHTVADLQESHLPLILDSGSCAQGRKGAWNLIDLKPNGCAVSIYRWDHAWTKTRTEEFAWTRK